MSMGALGAVSRLCGETFGSAMTFANPGQASAPGQVALDVVNEVLDSLRLRVKAQYPPVIAAAPLFRRGCCSFSRKLSDTSNFNGFHWLSFQIFASFLKTLTFCRRNHIIVS